MIEQNEKIEALQFIIDELKRMLLNGKDKAKAEKYTVDTPIFYAELYLKQKEVKRKMSNEEINVLINLHIAELESNSEVTRGEASRKRLIDALKQASELISSVDMLYKEWNLNDLKKD